MKKNIAPASKLKQAQYSTLKRSGRSETRATRPFVGEFGAGFADLIERHVVKAQQGAGDETVCLTLASLGKILVGGAEKAHFGNSLS
ncbi:hypothetical protein [Martelella mediterranea]|uniref:hypothetical protein n=1 Tax=Martelella mediterranea TaxID=293089 RepID=UPI0012BACA75|nr:hypothetical protein [Martelella mediterranea]